MALKKTILVLNLDPLCNQIYMQNGTQRIKEDAALEGVMWGRECEQVESHGDSWSKGLGL